MTDRLHRTGSTPPAASGPMLIVCSALLLMGLTCNLSPRRAPSKIDTFWGHMTAILEDNTTAQEAAPISPTLVPSTVAVPLPNGKLPLRPVVFHNAGSVPFTVSPWTYAPAGSSSPAVPPSASTVSLPGGNPSNALLLPLGSYTWCYWWDLGDINKDGTAEYAHALDERLVTLQESDSSDTAFARSVDLAAPADVGMVYGACGMDISPFVVDRQHVDQVNGAIVSMAHDTDYVVLKGPITVLQWYVHAPVDMAPGVPQEWTKPELITITEGETRKFELVERRADHPGDWNVYFWLVSVDG